MALFLWSLHKGFGLEGSGPWSELLGNADDASHYMRFFEEDPGEVPALLPWVKDLIVMGHISDSEIRRVLWFVYWLNQKDRYLGSPMEKDATNDDLPICICLALYHFNQSKLCKSSFPKFDQTRVQHLN
jgi:hypothetical protein